MNSNSRKSLFSSELVFLFSIYAVSLFMLYPRWGEYLATSAINQLETDFLYFDYIHQNIGDYSNSLITIIVEHMHASFNSLLLLSKFLEKIGVDRGEQLVLFFFAQVLLGIVGVYFTLKSLNFNRKEQILVFSYFLFSYFTQFGRYIGGPGFYNKVIASCLAISICYVIVALFVSGRHYSSSVISAMLIYIHPIYSAFFMSINCSYAFKACFFDRKWSIWSVSKIVGLTVLTLIPFALSLSASSGIIAGHGITDNWWDYLKAKTSNPFPLQDGFVIVVPTLIVFFVSRKLLLFLKGSDGNRSYDKVQWLLLGVIFAWLFQIFFTEILPVTFVARLSLTRVTPFGLFCVVIAFVGAAWRVRLRDSTGLWLIVLLAPAMLSGTQLIAAQAARNMLVPYPWLLAALGGYWPDFAIYPDILLLFTLLLVSLVLGGNGQWPAWCSKYFARGAKTFKGLLYLVAALITLVIWHDCASLFTDWDIKIFVSLICCLFLLVWVLEQLKPSLSVFNTASNFAKSHDYLIIVVLMLLMLWSPALKSFRALNMPTNDLSESEMMWSYIENNTSKDDMILIIPFFETRRYPVMPLRPVFIDWSEAQFVLYDYNMLDPVVERLSLMGMDIDKAIEAKQCDGLRQYVDGMCRRKLFESLSQNYSDIWRANVGRMREIAPNLKYAMIPSRYVRKDDNVLYNAGRMTLLKL